MLTIKEAEEILNKEYYRDNYEYLLSDILLPDYKKDLHSVIFNSNIFSEITNLGSTDSCETTVFEVYVKDDCQNRRVAITQEMFRILRNLKINNALVSFVNSDKRNFRISLLTSKYVFDGEKIVKTLSNPRRYSYSLGFGTKTKTAYDFLIKKGTVKTLDELINRFSVEVVNKQFYTEIATAFTELVGGERNGKSYEKLLKLHGVVDHNKYAEFGVRLIGRIMFCWFLREKRSENGISLVPDDMLSLDTVSSSTNYYHHILEPLFFELLNTNQNRRKKGFDNDYYNKVPYLNGGLFSPHSDDLYKYDAVNQCGSYGVVTIPNEWFFRLYSILNDYNFTVDENTAYDIELSIDPEMLGRIFENLLAEINPETGDNLKKATGSFYTPREIVDYMVDNSIIDYLNKKTSISENRLRTLLTYVNQTDDTPLFSNDEKQIILDALYTITVLDPACGSGAFPIGMLQKIVYILQELDPDAKIWFDKSTENINVLFKKEIEKKFNSGSLNYIRKLRVIQNSIFGVDIQPIAVEIARLRCFLSLIIEEKVNDEEENRGINPLPNLDFKFIIANSLLPLPDETDTNENMVKDQPSLFDSVDQMDRLKAVREEYFNTDNPSVKTELKYEFVKIQKEMFSETYSAGRFASEKYEALQEWDPFSNRPTEWFDSDWMFGIKDGFDIVIGNPPYGLLNKKQNQKSSIHVSDKVLNQYKNNEMYAAAKGGMLNIYRLFICRSHNLLRTGGHLSLIFPMAFLGDLSAKKLRKFIFENETIKYIEAFPERDNESKRVFQSAKISVCILGSNKSDTDLNRAFNFRINDDRFVNTNNNQIKMSPNELLLIDSNSYSIPLVNEIEYQLLLKICAKSNRMADYSKCYTGEIDLSLDKKFIRDDNSFNKMIRGAQVQKYYTTETISQGDILYLDGNRYLDEVSAPRSRHHKKQRIVMQGITGINEKNRLKMALIPEGVFCANSVNYLVIDKNIEYFLGLCNSELLNWFFKKLSTNSNVNGYEIDNLPVIIPQDKKLINYITECVKSITASTEEDTDCFKELIDKTIYEIYGLNEDEKEFLKMSTK